MARKLGTYPLSSNIEIEAGAPLDARTIVPLKADLTRAGSFPYPYVGMEVFVTEELQKYRLIGTNPELTDNWTKTDKGVVDGYYDAEHGGFYKDQGFTKPITGTSEVLYIDKSTDNVYRWNGSAFAQINPIDSQVPTIDMADERENIAQNDDVATIMGKIAKYFDDLGEVAFSDDYDDLDNTPTKLSEFENDPGYITDEGIVTSVKVGNTSYDPVDGVVSLPQYPDISGKADKATTLAGYGITDAKIANGTITLGANTITPVTDISGKADKATTLAGYGITDAKIANGTITLGSNTITPLTQHQDISGKADKATTLAGYGITDAKIANGTITLGSNTITPLTQHQDISGKADKATTLAGYGITDAKIANGTITLGSNTITPLTQHQDISGKADKATTLAGYGITDAKIANGTITLGSNTITPVTDVSGKADKATTLAGYGITDAKIASGTITLGSNSITPLTQHQTVTNKGATLAWSTAVTVATIGSTDIKVSLPANPNTDTTYTFTGGTNKFTVTPSGGTAQDITITPSIANNITGSGTSGYLAKFNGANTITSGPQLGSSTTTYLRNDGSWATPPDNNTTYTIATGDSNGQIKVTPSSGSAYNVSVKGLGSNAYTSTAYVPIRKNTDTYTTLASYYSGGTTPTYVRIAFPEGVANIWFMLNMEIFIRRKYSTDTAGKIIVNVHHGTGSPGTWTGNAITYGLPTDVRVYGSDGRYIYIIAIESYTTVVINSAIVGDAARSVDLSGTTIDNVTSIPTTYQTFTMYRGLDTSNYTDYTVKKDGTGASGSWGISVTGSAGSVAWSNVSSKPTTIAGYGITDAKIANGTITLGSNTITPLTSITSSQVTTALGYTPYNSTNPNGYITSSGSCASATKATQDGSGNVISTTYMKIGVDRVTAGQKSGTTLGVNATAEGSNNTASGRYSHAEGQLTVASEYYAHAEGYETTASGSASHAEGRSHETFPTIVTKATGMGSHAEGIGTLASGLASHAEGYADYSSSGSTLSSWKPTTASGEGSHAEGVGTVASATASHAEGLRTTAAGQRSHAEGWYSTTTSTGVAAHAEGEDTEASELAAHAEGYSTVASGYYSHAEGNNTIAASQAQHVEGKYNVEDANGTYAHIIGGGSSSTRKNIFTVDWSGNVRTPSSVYAVNFRLDTSANQDFSVYTRFVAANFSSTNYTLQVPNENGTLATREFLNTNKYGRVYYDTVSKTTDQYGQFSLSVTNGYIIDCGVDYRYWVMRHGSTSFRLMNQGSYSIKASTAVTVWYIYILYTN